MLKKKMLIALGVAAVLSVSCVSVTVWAEENAEEQTEEAEDSSNSEGEEDADLEESDNPEIEEGYTTELEGCTKVVSWCKNGDNNIYGQFYYPEDFDETKTYPVIIMSHGIGSTSQMVDRDFTLEQGLCQDKLDFFNEVFSIQPIIKMKRQM